MAFLQSKGKGHSKNTTGKGFGRKGNPKDRNGEVMKCRICQSTEHLMARCPKKGEGKGSSSSSLPGFTGYASESEGRHSSYLAGNRGTEAGTGVSLTTHPETETGPGACLPEAPRPPWLEDECYEFQAPAGYMVLSGDDPDFS